MALVYFKVLFAGLPCTIFSGPIGKPASKASNPRFCGALQSMALPFEIKLQLTACHRTRARRGIPAYPMCGLAMPRNPRVAYDHDARFECLINARLVINLATVVE